MLIYTSTARKVRADSLQL